MIKERKEKKKQELDHMERCLMQHLNLQETREKKKEEKEIHYSVETKSVYPLFPSIFSTILI